MCKKLYPVNGTGWCDTCARVMAKWGQKAPLGPPAEPVDNRKNWDKASHPD